jgi:hypothetical protein
MGKMGKMVKTGKAGETGKMGKAGKTASVILSAPLVILSGAERNRRISEIHSTALPSVAPLRMTEKALRMTKEYADDKKRIITNYELRITNYD